MREIKRGLTIEGRRPGEEPCKSPPEIRPSKTPVRPPHQADMGSSGWMDGWTVTCIFTKGQGGPKSLETKGSWAVEG